MGGTGRITLACLDLAGTTVADGGVVERAFAEALATQGIVPGTEAYGRAMARVHAARGQSKLVIFREVFSDEARAQAANHSVERAYDSVIAGTLTGAHDRERLDAAGATHVIDSIADLPDLLVRTSAAAPAPGRLFSTRKGP